MKGEIYNKISIKKKITEFAAIMPLGSQLASISIN